MLTTESSKYLYGLAKIVAALRQLQFKADPGIYNGGFTGRKSCCV